MHQIDAPFPHRHELGEAPCWDVPTQRLLYVDINAGEVHELDPTTGTLATIEVGAPVSFALPVDAGEELIVGHGNDLVLIERSGKVIGRRPVEPGRPGNRINEGKADPAGRLWFASMSMTRELNQAALYRLDHRGLHTEPAPITLGNGTDWDLERGRMYHVDSTTQRVDVLDYDPTNGTATNRRSFAVIDASDGLPDGLTVDAEGCVWLCLFQGGVVRRYDPDGELMETVHLPVTCPTSPAFGGPNLATLFITTTRHRLDPDKRAAQPLAGAVLALDVGVRGRPAHRVGAEVSHAVRRD